MKITMVGIDHSKASLDYREAFSFTKDEAKDAVKEIKERFRVKGCILLSTCNRTELWISQFDSDNIQLNMVSPYDMLCQIKNINTSLYEEYFVERDDSNAIDHLLKVVCGFDSKIFGEDQILSQVRIALQMSRECGCLDMSLEKIFQTALSAGKRVKTEVRMSTINHSSANDTVDILKSAIGDLKDISCLVIGNGQMGKLVANLLIYNGATVSMTLRRKIHGNDELDSIVPEGCKMVSYEDRISHIRENQVIISATLSPHYTLNFEEVKGILNSSCKRDKNGEVISNKYYLFDLAVPRDLDPQIGILDNVELYDIDSMNNGGVRAENIEQVKQAKMILEEYQEELDKWFKFRNYVPKVQEIVEMVSDDTVQRLASKTSEMEEEKFIDSLDVAGEAVKKATGKLIYGLREQLSKELWGQCLEALHKSAARDTLKH